MTHAELLKELGTTNLSVRFAEYYNIPQNVADYMIDKAWVINNVRHTFTSRGIGSWIKGGIDRDRYAIELQHTANGLVKEIVRAARASK